MIKIRSNVWETNSSSVHSLIMCTDEEYTKLERGELMIVGDEYPTHKTDSFVPREEVHKWFWDEFYPKYKSWLSKEYDMVDIEDIDVDYILSQENIAYTLDNFARDEYEAFDETYTTPGGEKIWAFGYFGRNG